MWHITLSVFCNNSFIRYHPESVRGEVNSEIQSTGHWQKSTGQWSPTGHQQCNTWLPPYFRYWYNPMLQRILFLNNYFPSLINETYHNVDCLCFFTILSQGITQNHYVERQTQKSSRLVIDEISRTDGGTYTCVVGPFRKTISLIIQSKFLYFPLNIFKFTKPSQVIQNKNNFNVKKSFIQTSGDPKYHLEIQLTRTIFTI